MRKRIIIRFILGLVIISVGLIGMLLYAQRSAYLNQYEEKASAVAELVRDTLTSYMVMGVIDRRDEFLGRIKEIEGVESIKVIRAESVNRQFGKGSVYEAPADDLESYVLSTGEPRAELLENPSYAKYRIVIPYKAEPIKGIDCLKCHQAQPGEVLGAISLTIDLTKDRDNALKVSFLSLVIFLGLVGWFYRYGIKLLEPYIETFKNLQLSLTKAKDGDFTGKTESLTQDEAGATAKILNQTLDELSGVLSDVEEKVRSMIGYGVIKTGNALKDTSKIVDELLRIYRFKRVIEKDKTKAEVYSRIVQLLSGYMAFDKFSLYELDSKRNVLKPVHVEGRDSWCKPSIYENADECRAKRTGTDTDSLDFACICPSFIDNSACDYLRYYCIPVYVGGSVGNVVQIVYDADVEPFVRMMIPYLKGYLHEASPVLEARTYMDMLREQSLVDQLTGLHNRRFLEEMAEKLSAQIIRRNSTMGILMVDIDYFKQVNDTYGHDVGDRLLKHVANIVKQNVRESDIVVRYGGEEIIILLVDAQEGSAESVAEKIRQMVESKPLEVPGGIIKKTVSIGVSEFPKDVDRIWQCIKFADVALYKAKEWGRNRVVRFTPDMWTQEEY